MERTTDPQALGRDGYAMTFSMPRALFALSILSEKEKMIIAKITSLSNKHIDKGGCNLSNDALARRHRCSKPVASHAISKAKWLGIQHKRTDSQRTYKTEDGATATAQLRRLHFTIPEIWEFFGEVWAEFYFKGCIASEIMLDWLHDELKAKESQMGKDDLNLTELAGKCKETFFTDDGLESYLEQINPDDYGLQDCSSKGGVLKSLRTSFEKFTDPFLNLYALKFTNNKFTNNKFTKGELSDPNFPQMESNKKVKLNGSNSSPKKTEEPPQKKPAMKERNGQYLPIAKRLAEIVKTSKNIKTPPEKLHAWTDPIRRLIESEGVDPDRLNTALDWYADNSGGQYIPVIMSGQALKDKFPNLENAMKSNGYRDKPRSKPTQAIGRPAGKQYPC